MNTIVRVNTVYILTLWINIIMDGPPAQSLGVEPVDQSIMMRPPRKKEEDILTTPLLLRVVTSAILILIGTMYIFVTELDDGKVTSRDRTMTFTAFVLFDLFNALTCRHNHRPLYEIKWDSNPSFLLAGVLSVIGQLCVIYLTPLQKIFRTVAISLNDIGFLVILASSIVVLDTIRKKFFPQYFTEMNNYRDYHQESLSKKVENATNTNENTSESTPLKKIFTV